MVEFGDSSWRLSFGHEEIVEEFQGLSPVEEATSIEIVLDPDFVDSGADLAQWDDLLVLQEFSCESSHLAS